MILPPEERLAWAIFVADGKTSWSAAPDWMREMYMRKAAKVQRIMEGFGNEARRNGDSAGEVAG